MRASHHSRDGPLGAGRAALPPPAGWTPRAAIAARHPDAAALQEAALHEIRRIEAKLDREEAGGGDTSCLRQILRELRWRLEYTADIAAIRNTIERAGSTAALSSPPSAALPSEDGSYGACTEVWFLKLDASVDRLLAPDFNDQGRPPRFLDRINDPSRLRDYLDSLVLSHPAQDGLDRRKELNFATADLVRLILWRRPANYPWHPGLESVIRQFIADWQSPVTGFFGAAYVVDGRRIETVDLSLTFHMARYLEGNIGYWPRLIDTLLSMKGERYPNGWLDEIGMTSHNNYDVAVLFELGWPHMRAHQHRRGRAELARLLDWCLTASLARDGEILVRAIGESLQESYYFTIAFLDTVGFFDRTRRFWTEREFAEAPAVRAALERRLASLPQEDPMVRMARQRLHHAGAAADKP